MKKHLLNRLERLKAVEQALGEAVAEAVFYDDQQTQFECEEKLNVVRLQIHTTQMTLKAFNRHVWSEAAAFTALLVILGFVLIAL